MNKVKGAINRLQAASRAMKGYYAFKPNEKSEENLDSETRKLAARRALNGIYVLDDKNKPLVVLNPVEVKEKKLFDTLAEAEAEEIEDARRERKNKIDGEAAKWRHDAVKDDSNKTVECIKEDYCCGCGACFSVCPVHAISMEYDAEGFLAPHVDTDKCTECGLCRKICPSLNLEYTNNMEPTCYAAYASTAVREKSSSGGIFTLMADYVFEQGGVVCGAGYTEDFKVEHFIIESPDELDTIRRSKYVQADASKVYADIKNILKSGRMVLFSGCGCQVAGLYAAIGNVDTSKLYTIDLMCHGGPSPKLFDYYLNYYHGKDKGRVKEVGFRDKDYFGWSTEMTVKYTDGTVYRKTRTLDPFYRAFLPCISTRKFCGHCAYAKLPRHGDVTLADFWGVEKYNAKYTDGIGTSIVSVNNEQGAKIYDAIKSRLKLNEKMSYEYILKTGQPYDHCFKNHPFRQQYFEQIANGSTMDKAYDYAVRGKYDVGVYGVWFGTNYGSVATYYGLHQVLRSLGLSVLMIDAPGKDKPADTHARRFSKKHYHISKKYTIRELKQLNSVCDAFVMGSDQVWNRFISRGFGFGFYLDFVDPDKKKIAFSSSFGHGKDFCNAQDRETISNYFSKFDGLSVRETSGVNICKEVYGVDAVRVLDPVFVAERSEYDKIADEATKKKDGKYLLAYILDPTPEKRAVTVYLAERMGLDIVVLLDGHPKDPKKNKDIMNMDDKVVNDITVEDWLNFFRNAEFVFTDSCHGMSFSIVFEKNFIAVGNRGRGVTRFESLADVFDVRDHYLKELKDEKEIINNDDWLKPVDYDKVNEIMIAERKRSIDWLKDKLFSPKVYDSHRAYSLIDKRLEDKQENN